MRLIVDARHYDSGIGTYTLAVLRALAEILPEGAWAAIVRSQVQLGLIEADLGRALPVWRFVDANMYSFAEQVRLARLPRGVVLLACHYAVPLLYRGSLIVTVHDLAHFDLPAIYPPSLKRSIAWMVLRRAVRQAKMVLTVSEVTREKLTERFGLGIKEKIRVVGNALVSTFIAGKAAETSDKQALTRTVDMSNLAGVSERSGGLGKRLNSKSPEAARAGHEDLPQKYVLFVGNLKPHKHPELVLEAVRILRTDAKYAGLHLVIVGRGDFSGSRARGLDLSADWVRHYRRASREDLAEFYHRAALLCLPSEYEGFGLPPLEALAAGVPIVLSDLPVFREVYQDAAVYALDYTPQALVESLREVLQGSGQSEVGHEARRLAGEACLKRYSQAAFTARLARALLPLLELPVAPD